MKPVILVIMDGVGFGDSGAGDAAWLASTPTLDKLLKFCPNTRLKAHGEAVGLPLDSDIGNSEVGHNALGCGQIYAQGAKLVNEAIKSGEIFRSSAWKELLFGCEGGTLHLLGLLSDGNVHSHIDHLLALISGAKQDGVRRVRVHILLDGRDVPATSALDYVNRLEAHLDSLRSEDFDCMIASGGGRMKITMDRYEANWPMVGLGWRTHFRGEGRQFESAREAIKTYRNELPGVIDQDIPPFVIAKDGVPAGTLQSGDSVILFNFRGDRAIEVSRAFDDAAFNKFDRGDIEGITFAGMLQYDGDLMLPRRYLTPPPQIRDTLTELLVCHEINEFAVSETQKFGHVTYFWNGNRSGKVSEELETYVEIPSDNISFDERPEMKSAEIADCLIEAIESKKYGFLRCNFPNGDMVGHTGNLEATIRGVEAVDSALSRIVAAAEKADAVLLVTADHGNAEDMLEKSKSGAPQPKTAHSVNPVPFIICGSVRHEIKQDKEFGLANVAATVATLLGIEPPETWAESIIEQLYAHEFSTIF